MNETFHGYDGSVDYTYGFCREMSPAWLDFAALLSGIAAPANDDGAAPRFLELGCGQGLSSFLIAGANPHREVVGIDVMPQHIEHARSLVAAAGLANVRFEQGDFVELARSWPEELGRFDHVALHGVYTWVSRDVRAAVVACLAASTRPGSLVYIGYNTQPGWLSGLPFQHLARLIHETGTDDVETVFDRSIGLFEKLAAGGTDTFRILPTLKSRLDYARTRGASYLAHEFLHSGWEPMWHSQVVGDLAMAGFSYVGTASMIETLLPDMLPPALRDTIMEIGDERLRGDVLDFVINQSFRRDIFVRGPVERVGGSAADAAMLCQVADLPHDASLTIKASFGEIALQYSAFAEVLAATADGPRSLGSLCALPGLKQAGADNARRLVAMLVYAGVLAPLDRKFAKGHAADQTNQTIVAGILQGQPYDHIAAPALGSAIPIEQGDAAALAGYWKLSHQGKALVATRLARWRELGAVT